MYKSIKLTWPQVRMAAEIGAMRHIDALVKNRVDRHPTLKDNGWTIHIEGAAGEIAAAAALNVFWPATVCNFSGPDIGQLQIKLRYRHDFELRIFKDSDPNSVYVLVTGKIPEFRVWGWLYGHEMKRSEWWKDPGDREQPAYFAPTSALHPLADIPPEAFSSVKTDR